MEAEVLRRALNRLTLGVLVCDEDQNLMWANAAALSILAQEDGLELQNGRVAPVTCEDARRWRLALEEGGTLPIHRAPGRAPLSAQILSDGRLGTTIFLSDPERPGGCSACDLEALYGLTPAEARAARCLADGESVAETAELLGVTTETIRGHLKKVFQKTGVRGQPQLVRMLVSGPGATRTDLRPTG